MHGLQACLIKYITVTAFCIYAQRGGDAPKGEVGGHALNSHGNTLLIMENHGKIMEFHFFVATLKRKNPCYLNRPTLPYYIPTVWTDIEV